MFECRGKVNSWFGSAFFFHVIADEVRVVLGALIVHCGCTTLLFLGTCFNVIIVWVFVAVTAEFDSLLCAPLAHSKLPSLVGTPGVDFTVLSHGEYMVLSTYDLARFHTHQAQDWLRLGSED